MKIKLIKSSENTIFVKIKVFFYCFLSLFVFSFCGDFFESELSLSVEELQIEEKKQK